MIGELTPEQVQRIWTKARPYMACEHATAADDHPRFEEALRRLNADIAASDREQRERLIKLPTRPAQREDDLQDAERWDGLS